MSEPGPRAFVAGWPIEHSRSPLIHRHWLQRYGLPGDYLRQPVAPGEADGFFRGLAASGFVGGNVTLPHKELAFQYCASRSGVAERLGAVNTLWLEGGKLHGDNTDVHGFTANLDERAPGWRTGGEALVLGAGGAARAVIQALINVGFGSVTILNRTPERAVRLAAMYRPFSRAGGLADLGTAMSNADLIVNTTSAGMSGEGQQIPIDWNSAKPDAIATDLVYVPLQTAFLAGAAARGLRTIDGLGMLLHQAAPGFQRWFGIFPEVDDDLRQIVLRDLGA